MKKLLLSLLLILSTSLPAFAAPAQHFICDSGCTGGSGTSNQGTPAAAANSWPVYIYDPISGFRWIIDASGRGTVNVSNTGFNATVDGVKTTASALGAGGSGTIGWLSHISDALHNALHVIVDSSPGPISGTILTSASATSCTNIQAVSGKGFEITNSGPATTVYLQVYNDASNACAAGSLLYGDGTTLTIGSGKVVRVDYPVAGLAYKLSGALSANLLITGL